MIVLKDILGLSTCLKTDIHKSLHRTNCTAWTSSACCMLRVLLNHNSSSNCEKQLKFYMQNFFACQCREQKSPTESLYGQTNKSTMLHKAISKQEPSLAYNLFQNTARFCFQHVYFSTNKDFMFNFPVLENGHLSASPPLFSLSLLLSELFSNEGVWKH